MNNWLNRNSVPFPYFTLCLTVEDYYRTMRELGTKESRISPPLASNTANATVTFTTNEAKEPCCIVFLEDNSTPLQTAGLLVHEAVHIWQEYAQLHGLTDTGKIEAQCIQAISQALMAEYARQKFGFEEE